MLTYRPKTVIYKRFEYYYGSLDRLKTYDESTMFCHKWGGLLLSIDSEAEYMIIRDTSQIYWYGSNEGKFKLPVTEGKKHCLALHPELKRLWKIDSCQTMYQFICKKELG